MKKWDAALLAAFLAVGGLLVLFLRVNKAPGGTAVVRVSGQVTAEYSLSEKQTVTIKGKNGGTNELVIENGTAHISEASCPDKLCVHQGTVSKQGQTIVCLPNEVVIEITGIEEEEPYDAIAK